MSASISSGYQGLIYKVAVPSPLRRIFDYLPPESNQSIATGTRVQVHFGRRKVVAYVLDKAANSELELHKLKPIHAVLDSEPIFPTKLLNLLQWCAQYYHHPLGEVLSTACPGKLRSSRSLCPQQIVYQASSNVDQPTLDSLSRAPKQRALLEFFNKKPSATKDEIESAGFSAAIIKSLEEKKFVERTERSQNAKELFSPLNSVNPNSLKLNSQQQQAFDAIKLNGDKFNCFLIDGVTGSGKTEIYMQVMQHHLSKGRQCLVLVPEIGLTPQTVTRFSNRFDCPIVVLHSGLTDNDRLEAWRKARAGSIAIIIGTRSAIFTPLPNLGLIIVDEEHDGSFKQQDGFRYSARDVAVMRGREENVPIILGSATPSLESLQNAESKKFSYLTLSERAGGAIASATTIIDTANEILDSGFSEQLLCKIDQHLTAGNQVLVFINRRGFAPILSCASCGWIAECEDCVSQMSVHAKPPSLRCHHCGITKHIPAVCPTCNGGALGTIGVGTQRLEKFLEERFSTIPVIRIDRDSTRSKNKLTSMLNQIQTGEPCILLGTQILAKGHHFPAITLVAIIDADAGLFSPDFRGQEFMAQTVTQVSGRAGRAKKSGEVAIQTRHSTHKVLTKLTRTNYKELAMYLMEERKAASMPPFAQLVLLKAEGNTLNESMNLLQQMNKVSIRLIQESNSNIRTVGPVPAPMEKKAGRYRAHLLLKAETKTTMQQFLTQFVYQIDQIKLSRNLRWSLDVDPREMI